MNEITSKCNSKKCAVDHHNRITNVAIASNLVKTGFKVFPCQPSNKRPTTQHGFHDASRDTSAWDRSPSALVGLPCIGHWVLDLDAPLDKSIAALCARLGQEWEDIVDRCGLVVCTPSGGLHLYFKRISGLAIRTAAGAIGLDIDTRGHDANGKPTGYTIAPGCQLPDGRRYSIQKGSLNDLVEASRRLLLLAHFSRREREVIAKDARLESALRASESAVWRETFNAHDLRRSSHYQPKVANRLMASGYRAQFLWDLEVQCRHLASLADGRRCAVFLAAARLARYCRAGLASPDEIETALLGAWRACGGDRKSGLRYARDAVRRALIMGANDPLPPLMRRFRHLATE